MKVRLVEVARESRESLRGSKGGLPIVGLEHLTPGELTLTEWDVDSENTFTKVFRKGQMLFGRRRAYLQKAAVAPFDGICSGDITVIEAFPDKLVPELLPFIIQNDAFFDYAVGKSAGSLSPRAKWEHLQNFEFTLPPLAEQRKLANLLWAATAMRESYKKLLAATDELIKSQFVEMFGDPIRNSKGWAIRRLGEIAECFIGLTYKPEDVSENGTIVLRSGNVQNGELDLSDVVRVRTEVKERLLVRKDDILMCSRNGSARLVGKVAHIPDLDEHMTFGAFMTVVRSEYSTYLLSFFCSKAFSEQITTAKTSTINQITKSMLDNIQVPIPPLSLQTRFADFVKQADKSKFELQRAIDELEATYKSLLRENLG